MARESWKVEPLLVGSWRGATSVLISDGRHSIVVDSGMPHEAHLLLQALDARGLKTEDIRSVINTHFHVDHVLNNSLFPNSLIYASQESHDWCSALYSDLRDEQNWEKLVLKYYPETHENERAAGLMHQLRKLALRWWDAKRLGDPSRFRWLEHEALPDGLEAVMTSGHVPGHVSVVVPDGSAPAIIAGDAVLSGQDDAGILTMIPHDREQFLRDRARIRTLGGRILPGHGSEFISSGPDATAPRSAIR
jgi:glyoxylase-like metal-dependent hydrolase (beta-lactamase superfamily II)